MLREGVAHKSLMMKGDLASIGAPSEGKKALSSEMPRGF